MTIPLLGPQSTLFFRPPPQEKLSDEYYVNDLFSVQYSISHLLELRDLLQQGELPGPGWYALLEMGEALSVESAGTDDLLSPRYLAELWRKVGVIPYRHQLETARRVLFELGGRAILADEVGLGKTIEAGLIVKEALLRRLARKVLILTPASLCWQWFNELKEKFNIPCGMQRSKHDWEHSQILIASLDTAKRSPHREIIERIPFDILVVDEAHRLKNEKTQNYQFINSIQRKYCLMLTATPMQNELKELYNLINLVRPGQLGTYRQFKSEFVQDMRTPKETHRLKELLGRVMIRNRRGKETVEFTSRQVHSIPVDLSPEERHLYDEVTRFVREEYRKALGTPRNILPLITLQREVCSSAIAAAMTLEKNLYQAAGGALQARLQSLLNTAVSLETNTKARFLEQLVTQTDEKVIVFTEYRATQAFLRWRLEKAGVSTLAFDGSLSASRKGWIRELFRNQARVLVSTESGGEGLNFQFCRNVVNYDLPWNPMRLEQRIGRVHRLGQTRDVRIFNLATRDTIEEHILYLLYEKINMFQMILGDLDAILSRLKLSGSFEKELTDILIGSDSRDEVRSRLDHLAESIIEARQEADQDESDSLDRLLSW